MTARRPPRLAQPGWQIERLRQHLEALAEELPDLNGDSAGRCDLPGSLTRRRRRGATPGTPWIPARMATLLHSFGGVGKSLLAQQIATAYALGLELFGGATEGRPALVLAGEDDA